MTVSQPDHTKKMQDMAERLVRFAHNDGWPTSRRHLAEDLLCEIYRLGGSIDPEGETGKFVTHTTGVPDWVVD